MKNQALIQWIEPLEEVVEAHLLKATSVYQNLSEEALSAKPDHDGWSAAQCIYHLNTYSDFYLPRAQKALSRVTPRHDNREFRSGFLGKLLKNTIKPENKLKLKALKAHRPAADVIGATTVAQFIEHQEQWLRLISEVESVNQLDARVESSISFLIRFKLGDVFAFMKAHDARHLQQADRVLATLPEKV
ncbi:DinB family protein [Persicitalea jodogahamensis]|uniref:DinB-like domain-containing protein n=1 Tax=Persicitalea jodogahamensis TaxID=402147 RepID=A0A8J3D864_9BACT|nr:DinB family protein [Persicitalea jodogahamensis]GHB65814.1 hypothetical protein GCM10007390_19910 [Persicitalea jodogahamensis]